MSLYSSSWSPLPSLPDPEGFAGMYAGTCGETMICAGGTNFPDKPMLEGGTKTWTDRIFTLSPGENGWTEAGTLPAPYAYGASASTREGLLCIGGCGKEGHRKDVYLLSTADGAVTVTPFPPLPIALAYTAAAVLDGKVYLTGGCERPGEQDCTNRVFMLDARGPEQGWQELDPLPGRGRFLHQMSVIRKELNRANRFYAQLSDFASSLLEEAEDLFGSHSKKRLGHFLRKVESLQGETRLLHEYATQISSEYQAQVDIAQNRVMKVLTIVTAIFLPLTLIAGWYGMNFTGMPLLEWRYGYPAVVAVSALVVAGLVWYFKRKKWF